MFHPQARGSGGAPHHPHRLSPYSGEGEGGRGGHLQVHHQGILTTLPYHTIPYPTIPYHTIPYHTTPTSPAATTSPPPPAPWRGPTGGWTAPRPPHSWTLLKVPQPPPPPNFSSKKSFFSPPLPSLHLLPQPSLPAFSTIMFAFGGAGTFPTIQAPPQTLTPDP